MNPSIAGNPPQDTSFNKDKRLLNSADYSYVFDGAEIKASHKYLLILARRNNLPNHRLGLVIAKKNVRHAVQRNKVKRIAREFFRKQAADDICFDVVVLARRGLGDLSKQDLLIVLQQAWGKLQYQSNKLSQPM